MDRYARMISVLSSRMMWVPGSSAANVKESIAAVVSTAQFVVASRRARHAVDRCTSPR